MQNLQGSGRCFEWEKPVGRPAVVLGRDRGARRAERGSRWDGRRPRGDTAESAPLRAPTTKAQWWPTWTLGRWGASRAAMSTAAKSPDMWVIVEGPAFACERAFYLADILHGHAANAWQIGPVSLSAMDSWWTKRRLRPRAFGFRRPESRARRTASCGGTPGWCRSDALLNSTIHVCWRSLALEVLIRASGAPDLVYPCLARLPWTLYI